MDPLAVLCARAGAWAGSNTLSDPHTGRPALSATQLVITPLLGGRFVRLDYTWAYGGRPQAGSLLLGYQAASGQLSGHWIDSWHMGDAVMVCSGDPDEDGSFTVTGSYAAPPGPDWGWRIAIRLDDDQALRLEMINIAPDGAEEPAVTATYTPA